MESGKGTYEMFNYLNNKISEYVNYLEYKEAQYDFFYNDNEGLRDKQNLIEMISFAAYAGSILRLGYYKFVHKQEIDVRIYSDAIVQAYTFGGVYQFGLTECGLDKELKVLINKTSHPFWTKFCIYGGGTKELKDEGKKFSLFLDELKERESNEMPTRYMQLELQIKG